MLLGASEISYHIKPNIKEEIACGKSPIGKNQVELNPPATYETGTGVAVFGSLVKYNNESAVSI